MKTKLNHSSAKPGRLYPLAHHFLAASIFLGTLLGSLALAWSKPERCEGTATSVQPHSRISKTRPHLLNDLSSSRSGRVLLHTFCLIRHPERARWHWHGILRELTS
jgi:hypothetical protein